ncbi:MAG: maleylacetoacetate isomerase [Rhodospirillaceae bacterium]|nr:maleylacetoacetate isomerase [Rhodospirillaceae bacterium]
MKLFDYARSSAATRVRIALALKDLPYTSAPIHLLEDGGQHHSAAYKNVNPQELVPALDIDGAPLTQSLAIIEYLDEIKTDPPLLPHTALDRARVRAMALCVATDIHPIQNLRVLNYLRGPLSQSEDAVATWARHWILQGLQALEKLTARVRAQGTYCFGDTVTLADICLAPQMVNARRFDCDTTTVPRLVAIDDALRALPAFAESLPSA